MRTFNNIDIVSNTLVALKSQQNISYELIIVDSGSEDGTLDIVRAYANKVIQIKNTNYIPGPVLNQAIKAASNDTVVLLNSDTVLMHPYSLANLVESFVAKNLTIASGRQIARPDAYLEVKDGNERSFPARALCFPAWMTFSAPVSILSREVIKRHPFYSKSWGSEDTELGVRLKQQGFNTGYINTCLAMHSHNYSLKQLFRRGAVEGDADVYIYNKTIKISFIVRLILGGIFRHVLVNIKGCSLRFIFIGYPLAKSIGYLYGVIQGRKRKHGLASKMYYRSYQ